MSLVSLAWPARVSAQAEPPLPVDVEHANAPVGEPVLFRATVLNPVGAVQYRWRIQEPGGSPVYESEYTEGASEVSYTFENPGNYRVQVQVQDTVGFIGTRNELHVAHYPLTPSAPTMSSTIVYDSARDRIYNVNPDNDTITAIDASGLVKLWEMDVFGRPEALALAPDGRLWVLHRDDYAVAIVNVDTPELVGGFRLPYASQPIGLAMSPIGDAAYVTLQALGTLVKLDPMTGAELGRVAVGGFARGVSVSHDGQQVFVTRFISPDSHGEVVLVDAASLQVVNPIQLLPDTDHCNLPGESPQEGDQAGRGLPNYLFSIGLTPDGLEGWVAGKKDNIFRGPARDGLLLNKENTVRPMLNVIDVMSGVEDRAKRMDLDDRNLPSQVVFSPLGNWAFVALTGNSMIHVRDRYLQTEHTTFGLTDNSAGSAETGAEPGKAPRGFVLVGDRLFVHGFLSRSVIVLDAGPILENSDAAAPFLAEIPTVQNEKLAPEVLHGKGLFYDSENLKMATDGYLSCASCHFDGFEDGRVWDFMRRGAGTEPPTPGGAVEATLSCDPDPNAPPPDEPPPVGDPNLTTSLREGLRNTTSLLGRRGMGHGPVHWSGNFDEIQDFECEIRLHFSGSGFIPTEVFPTENCDNPLGTPTAGLSQELDNLAAYVSSLDTVHRSPYKNPDGTLTADGEAGFAIFNRLGCDFCHVGSDFTDSARGKLHDVGTLKPASGMRSGEPLTGIDTPTLLGVWETAPYLHDGSAPTVKDVLTTANPNDEHGFVSSLTEQELNQLVAYVLQIDGDPPVTPLPFENVDEPDPIENPPPPPRIEEGKKGMCQLPSGGPRPGSATAFLMLPLAFWLSRHLRRRRPAEQSRTSSSGFSSARFTSLGLAGFVILALTACSGPAPDGATPPEPAPDAGPDDPQVGPAPSWDDLPSLIEQDVELTTLPRRMDQYEKLCALDKNDPFFTALCAERPNITGMTSLLRFLELHKDRAFALTGNSTSLVAGAVSALNPRIIVFPKVGPDLERLEKMSAIGFVRGEHFVEIVSRDLVTQDLNFYVLAFEQQCRYETECDLAALLTEEIERDWTAYSVYSEEDLENTSFDCRACHQPGGFGTPKILRMQELDNPWLHWFPQRFVQRTDSDRILVQQFQAAHSVDQHYGGIPIDTIVNALGEGSAAQLEALIRSEGHENQPNVFDPRIEDEAKTNPEMPIWRSQFEATLRGEAIAVPYPLVDVTDEALRTAATTSYVNVVTGAIPRDQLVDIRDVFSEDAKIRLGFLPEPGADGRTVLIQMCSRCHNGRGNPDINRHNFNVLALDQLSDVEKNLAIQRMQGDRASRAYMPPLRAGELTPEALQAAISALSTP